MRKLTIVILRIFIVAIGGYFVWWHLPLAINRASDIKLGEKIIKNIETYKIKKGLPQDNDWKTLKQLGFRDKGDFFQPEYRKVDDNNFELIYVESFDGPYLI
jgi:hypothetical protein